MNKDVSIKMKLPNGQLEGGEGSGMFRDCQTEFWNDFYNRRTLGAEVKTPFLRHEYQVEEWQATVRIILKGWLTVRYFPVLLPLPFLEEALYDTSYSSVKDCFMQYISKAEREILQMALDSFQSVDKDDLIDVLDVLHTHAIRFPLRNPLLHC